MLFLAALLVVIVVAAALQWSSEPGEDSHPLPLWEADEDLPPAPRHGLPTRPTRTLPGEKR